MTSKLRIGWGEADITPVNAKVELAGQYYQRLATGIHSRIKTVVLALKNDQQAIMISLGRSASQRLYRRGARAVHRQFPEIAPTAFS